MLPYAELSSLFILFSSLMWRFLTLSRRSSSAWISASSCRRRDVTHSPSNGDPGGSLPDLFQMSQAQLEDLLLLVVLSQGQPGSGEKQEGWGGSVNAPFRVVAFKARARP